MNVSFRGIAPPYKTAKADIYPIESDISPSEINAVCRNVKTHTNLIGEGVNGIAYSLGRDLVAKKSKKNALVNPDVMNEAKKLDMLYEFNKEAKHYMGNTQKGVCAFTLNNGDSILISSFVKGKKANPDTNPLNSKNLSSLLSILTELDKGSEKYGRLMVNDLNLNNINFTKDEAGILDFEHLQGYKLDDNIQKTIINKEYGSSAHTSDTSFLDSNVRSFEYAGLYYYLQDMPSKEAGEIFKEYLKTKSSYHKQMSDYFSKEIENSRYTEIVKNIAKSEKAHYKLLSRKVIPEDIVKAEAIKIQMSNFVFVSSRWCNASYIKFNPKQVMDYYKNSLNYFESQLTNAKKQHDEDRITYYNDCLNLFCKWNKIQLLHKTMRETQKARISATHIITLDKIVQKSR